MATFPSSATDQTVKDNILKHIRKEEGMVLHPYIDPNYQQANIGMGHTFYHFPDEVIAASRKIPRKQRAEWLLQHLPDNLKNLRWSEKQAYDTLYNDYSVHRNRAKRWLSQYGMDDDGRLVDQLGMLFFGSRADVFMGSRSAKAAADNKDYDALSAAASRFGRTADGVPLPALAKRRNAERNFYLGQALPTLKDSGDYVAPSGEYPAEAAPRDVWGKIRAQTSSSSSPFSDDDFADESALFGQAAGERARKQADKLVWDLMLHPGMETPPEMPEDFDSVVWANEIMAGRPPRQEWAGSLAGVGMEGPADVRNVMPYRASDIPDYSRTLEDFENRAGIRWEKFLGGQS